ncbi:related to UTP14 - subunit of U3-containing small subunit processome complex [Melanopsichium pennsylvanicum]|uniref:Related to UTP14 - subunit of U3-containing small subunit processome complex n=2 Tax=Melanopsichium pennsylvanicum TaxID=63383 RepID=A0AAJ4XPN2_9BASI|nr:conserved hypothetical protein [Melanopsichium pennsylvanicum 4]SNX86829.1 related to UTP14 - subunit of U3-containing small subunit processome complex [Melanopsichium pennsylvanicum]
MVRQSRATGGAPSTSSGGRSGGRKAASSLSTPFSSSSYGSGAKSRRTARSSNPSSKSSGASGLHDVYDLAQASTSNSNSKRHRRALAGMNSTDYADLPSKAKRNPTTHTRDDQQQKDEDEDSDDQSDAAPIGPKVFDSQDELDAQIEGSDEELDSDEAFGESDQERFDGWTFGRGVKHAKRKSEDSEQEQDQEVDQHEIEDEHDNSRMVDLSRMLDSASESSEEDQEDQNDISDQENDHSSNKLARHIESFAAGTKRPTATNSDLDAGSDAEPSSKRTRRVLSERTEAIPETEFAAAHSGSTLRLEDFMNPLSSNIDFADVRKSTKTLSNPKSSPNTSAPAASKKGGGALSAPLPSVVQDRLDRQGAYSITRDQVQGWQPTINRLRDAEHISFPLQQPAVTKASTSGLVATFNPDGEMEASIAAMLTEGGLTEKQLAQQEDLAMNKLDPEEARARRDELRRMRMLMFRAEQKAKRVSKIKSKAYRKIHRKEKERLKAHMKELGSDAEDFDSEEEMEDRLRVERDRARERATLKHKNTSKWAKNILSSRHGEHNQEARNELDAQLRRGTELRSKIQGRDIGQDSSDDDSSDDSGGEQQDGERAVGDAFDELAALEAKEEAKRIKDEEEFERVGGKKGVYNMKFMKDARERQYSKIRGDVDDFVTEMQGIGAHEQSDSEDAEEDAGQVVIAGKGADADEAGGSSVYVQGNKGRAMYGTTNSTLPKKSVVETQNDDAPNKISQKVRSTPANLVNGTSAGVEIGGNATVTKPRSTTITNAKKSSRSSLSNHAHNADGDDDDDACNPWLVIDSHGQSNKLSRKKNDSSLSANSTSAVAASKSALKISKNASKSSSAIAARKKDEAISIDLDSYLEQQQGPREGQEYESEEVDSDGDAVEPVGVVNELSRKQKKKNMDKRGVVSVLEQRELVASAFAGDDVVSDFLAEKALIEQEDETKVVDTRLPGWGSWTGKGIRKPCSSSFTKDQKYVRTIQGVDKEKRKDRGMDRVIISEKRDKKQDKYQLKDLPYPYTSLAQYKSSMQQPLGKEWNTRIETQRLNMPRVIKKPGKIITPVVRKF